MENLYARCFFTFVLFVQLWGIDLRAQAPYTISGNVYVDHDNNAVLDGLDYGHPAITVQVFEDVNANGISDAGETVYGSDITDQDGNFSIITAGTVPSPPATFTIGIDTDDLAAGYTVSNGPITTATGNYTNVALSFQGENVVCYTVSDASSPDALVVVNRKSGTHDFIGTGLGASIDEVEAISFDIGANTLYAIDADQLGVINLKTGTWTATSSTLGTGQHPTEGDLDFTDADGMSFDPFSGELYATHREVAGSDVLFKIDITTGAHVDNAFGPGQDYLVLTGAGLSLDVDDIAISPVDGKMYGINNDNGSDDVLVEIDLTTGVMTSLGAITDAASGGASPLNDVEGFGFTNSGILIATTGDAGAVGLSDAVFVIDLLSTQATLITNLGIGGDYEACDCLTQRENVLTGTVFSDTDENGVQNGSELGLANIRVLIYIDNNGDGVVDAGDTQVDFVLTDANGNFEWETSSDLDFVMTLDPTSFPPMFGYSTDPAEVADFAGGFGGQSDPSNNFGLAAVSFPIELVDFSVEQQGIGAKLTWLTASEINSDHFEIERALNPADFSDREMLGTVRAAGFSTSERTYDFFDRTAALQGVNKLYYRLRAVDFDGTYDYSHIVELTISHDGPLMLRLRPNPVTDGHLEVEYMLQGGAQGIQHISYRLMDSKGKVALSGEASHQDASGSLQINTSNLANGQYILHVLSETSSKSVPVRIQNRK